MAKLTTEQKRKNMQAVRSKGSEIERILAKAVWARGLRYRKNDKTVFGKPDLTMKRHKIAIFVDSEFWHGKDWSRRKKEHKSNIKFWHNKIQRNMARDAEVTDYLVQNGWIVLRFWGEDVKKNLRYCVHKIENTVNEIRKGNNHRRV